MCEEYEELEGVPEELECTCGNVCMDCLGMSWSDFM